MHILPQTFALFELGGTEIFLIVFLCLLMFGSKKLPELAKAMGQSMREFKKAASDVEDNFRSAMQEEDRKKNQLPSNPLPSNPPAPQAQGRALEHTQEKL